MRRYTHLFPRAIITVCYEKECSRRYPCVRRSDMFAPFLLPFWLKKGRDTETGLRDWKRNNRNSKCLWSRILISLPEKPMKKIVLGMIMSLGFFHSAFALNIMSHSSIQTNCDGGTFPPLVIYGTDTIHMWDYINAAREGIISSNSEVSVYVQGNKVNIPNGWAQVSNYLPSAGQFYTVWNNQLTGLNLPSLVPADRDTPVAQVVYRIRRMYTGPSNTYNFGGNYTYANFTGGVPSQTSLGNLNRGFDTSTLHVDNECISILPRWCGDSVVDSGHEQCDL